MIRITYFFMLCLTCSYHLSSHPAPKTHFLEGDITPFSLLMKKARSACAKESKAPLTEASFKLFRHHFPNGGPRQKIPLDRMDILLSEAQSQITSLQSLKSDYENSLSESAQEDNKNFWNAFTFGKFAILFLDVGETLDDQNEEESITEGQYIDICEQLKRLQVVQDVIERCLKKMNAEVDQKMTLDFLLERFKDHPNPKFNANLVEGNARVRALLKDIYCIE